MRQKITLLLMCIFFAGTTYAQQKRTCHAMEDLENRKRQDPTLQKRMDAIEKFTQRKIKENKNTQRKISGEIITIPVVIHILYTNSTNNISTAQIQSQLDVLNADFRRTNSDRTNKWSQAADTQIEFKLATIDPNGNPTTGVTRTSVSKSTWDLQNQNTSNDMKKSSRGGVDPWNTSEYLNMWIVDKLTRGSGTILGFAQFPGGDASTDGVVMADQYFGTTGTAQSPFDGGRTTTHEVGHFLNLRHIWGDGPCGSDDFVSDTPESDAPNYGCKTGHTSCGSEDMVQNYMDYSDDTCMNLFTLGQKNRMRAILEAGGSRRSLALSDKFGSGSVCNATVPTGVSTSAISASGATVNWTAVSGATYDVRYRKAGTSSWTTSASSSTSAILSGLSASTQYQVQVRSKCSSGNSNYSSSVNFSTSAKQINYCSSSGNTSYATGVTRVVFGSINNADGPSKNVGYENFTNLSTTVSQSSSVNLTVSVNTDGNYRADAIAWIDWNQDGDFTDNGETYDLGNISNVSNGALATKSVAVPSNAKVGATRMRVSARYNANPTSCQTNFDGEVEDYTVNVQGAVADTQAPSAPNSLTASSITQTTLTLNWSSSTDNVGVTGYDVYRGSTKLGSTTTATSYNVIGLTANTAYSFTVRAKDASGNISSSSNTASVTTLGVVVSYCASKGNRDTYEWIDYVSFGGMTNTTGKNGGYGDFTSKVATVAQGSTNQLLVSAGFRSSAYNEYFTIWIDYNKNGTFESNEKVASGNSTSSGNRSSNITIPSSASLGQTRMRVSMKYNGASTACETFADGEVEDYTVNITANTSKGTSISNIETLRDESGLDLMVYPNPTTNFIEVNVASKSDNITYSVVNTIGSVVKSGKMISRTLDVSNLKSGVYMIEVNDGQKSLRTKFIKK